MEAPRPAPSLTLLPAFADARNRELDRQVKELEAQLEQTRIAVEENNEHVKVLSEHLGNVRQEIGYTQGRVTAKAKEVETEEHLRELSRREAGRLRTDAGRLRRRQGQLAERVAGMQRDALAAAERVDQFRLAMSFNQEELEQWTAAAKQKEEDQLAMERYMRQDEARVKELSMQLERVARDVQQRKQELDEEVTATQAAQTELNKAAEDFRQLHAERAELLAQWEGVLEAVAQRDAAILEAGGAFAAKKAELAQLKVDLDAAAVALAAEEGSGTMLENQATQQERGIKRLYDTYAEQQAAVAEAEDQLDILGNTTQKAAEEVAQQQAANGHLRTDIERRGGAVEAARQRYEQMRAKLAVEGQQLGTLQQKIQELEALRQQDEQRASALEKEIGELTKRQFAAGQELHAARQREKGLAGEISGARAQSRNLAHQMARLEEKIVRQQEVLYNVDFQLVAMERRVARAAGQRTQDETEALNARIAALTQALESVKAEHAMLVQQVKRAEDDYARAQRQNQAASKEKAAVLDEMSRTTVETESIARAFKAASKQKEERLVESDVWRLETRRLRSLLTSKADQVMSLEHRKRALELGMAERQQEIAVQMELMQGEARLLRDETHRLALELRERQLSLDKLRAKYETLVAKARTPDGEELQSQAYYIVKAAQKRQELQAEAQEVAAHIAQTERECKALEAHLANLVGTNSEMNQHFRFNCNQQAAEEQAELKRQLDNAFELLKVKRGEERSREMDVEEAKARLANLQAEEAHMRRLLVELEAQKAEAGQQLREQAEKTARAAQRAEKLRKQLAARGSGGAAGLPAGAAGPADVEADVQLAQVKDATRAMLDQLQALAAEHPEANIAQQVERELGLKLAGGEAAASRPGSSRSSPAPSVRSSPAASLRGAAAGPPRPGSSSSLRSPAAGPRPGSSGSVRSAASARSTGLSVCTMQLGL